MRRESIRSKRFAMNSAPSLELRSIVQTFYQAGSAIEVLKGASLSIGAGELVAMTGPSGAGKSTLLQIAGLLERPADGCVRLPARTENPVTRVQI